MKDTIIKGTGNSRYLKSNIPADITHEQLVQLLRNGTMPIDLNGINMDGIEQLGTPLNTATMLQQATAALLGLEQADPTVDDAFKGAATNLNKAMEAIDTTVPYVVAEGEEIHEGDIVQIVDGYAKRAEEQPIRVQSVLGNTLIPNYDKNNHQFYGGAGLAALHLRDNIIVFAGGNATNASEYLKTVICTYGAGGLQYKNYADWYTGYSSTLYGSQTQLVKIDNDRYIEVSNNGRYVSAQAFRVNSTLTQESGTRMYIASVSSGSISFSKAIMLNDTEGIVVYSGTSLDTIRVRRFTISDLTITEGAVGSYDKSILSNKAYLIGGLHRVGDNGFVFSFIEYNSPNIVLTYFSLDQTNFEVSNVQTVTVAQAYSADSPCSLAEFGKNSFLMVYTGSGKIVHYAAFEVSETDGTITITDTAQIEPFTDGEYRFNYNIGMAANGNGKVMLPWGGRLNNSTTTNIYNNVFEYDFETKQVRNTLTITTTDMTSSTVQVMSQLPNLPSSAKTIKTAYINPSQESGWYAILETQINGVALAENSGVSGETIRVIYAGEHPVKGLKAGTHYTTTDGLLAMAYSAGLISVNGYWNADALKKGKIYVSTGTYTGNLTSVTLPCIGDPIAFIAISPSADSGMNGGFAIGIRPAVKCFSYYGYSHSAPYTISYAVSWGDNAITVTSGDSSIMSLGGYYMVISMEE